jgi:hypothetical protein
MGTVAGVTSQLSSIGGCTPARDCCGDVDALKAQVSVLNARISAVEGKANNAAATAAAAVGAVGLLGTQVGGLST